MASKNKNSFAIAKYANTSSKHYVTNVIKNNNSDNNVSSFNLFTLVKPIKKKLNYKKYDKCNQPYNVSMDNTGNAYILWDVWNDTTVSDVEIKQIEKVCLIALDVMVERGLKLTKSNLLDFISKVNPLFYTNGVDVVSLIRQYKKQHNITPSKDTSCIVWRNKSGYRYPYYQLGRVVK